eukprot:5493494-Pleurochrysis_carterae.AAC.3
MHNGSSNARIWIIEVMPSLLCSNAYKSNGHTLLFAGRKWFYHFSCVHSARSKPTAVSQKHGAIDLTSN